MIRIADLMDPECILLDMPGRKKKDIVRKLADTLERAGKIDDAARLAQEVLEREKLASTGIGQGIALPHRLTPAVQETVLAMGRSRKGVKYDSPDRIPVRLVFLIVGPEDSHSDHLRLLSRLSRLLCEPEFLDGLDKAETPQAVVDLFRRKEPEAAL